MTFHCSLRSHLSGDDGRGLDNLRGHRTTSGRLWALFLLCRHLGDGHTKTGERDEKRMESPGRKTTRETGSSPASHFLGVSLFHPSTLLLLLYYFIAGEREKFAAQFRLLSPRLPWNPDPSMRWDLLFSWTSDSFRQSRFSERCGDDNERMPSTCLSADDCLLGSPVVDDITESETCRKNYMTGDKSGMLLVCVLLWYYYSLNVCCFFPERWSSPTHMTTKKDSSVWKTHTRNLLHGDWVTFVWSPCVNTERLGCIPHNQSLFSHSLHYRVSFSLFCPISIFTFLSRVTC